MKGFLITCVLFGVLLLQTSVQGAPNTGDVLKPDTAGNSGGKVSAQILSGSKATPKQIPWHALLVIDSSKVCGGSVISSLWVVTTASVVMKSRTIVIHIGGVDYYNKYETGEVVVTTKTYIVHEKFNNRSYNNDIAVVKITPKELLLSEYIRPIRLPKNSQATLTFAGLTMQACGYGKTGSGGVSSSLNYVNLITMANADCVKAFSSYYVISSTICTAVDATKAICDGDVGGSLAYKESDGNWTLIGIASFQNQRSCVNYPAAYTRVQNFLDWISKKTGIVISP
ncbi:chymotrypsin BII-like [Neocloeon triangulifer]|uniref:chymotrypsin BII-like n=1 Tax=Neocloeon triangulifer TaxID=2078957 RepID=UPI00286ED2B9|nr:chymotrypsin BII-like [Neocloeon triangulifer]